MEGTQETPVRNHVQLRPLLCSQLSLILCNSVRRVTGQWTQSLLMSRPYEVYKRVLHLLRIQLYIMIELVVSIGLAENNGAFYWPSHKPYRDVDHYGVG